MNEKYPSLLDRLIGLILILGSLIGIGFSVVGIRTIWQVKIPLHDQIETELAFIQETIFVTDEALSVATTSLSTASDSVNAIEDTLEVVAGSVQEISPLIDAISILLIDDIPDTLQAAQISLIAAQSSAKIIDDVLALVTTIPFFPGDPYEPPVPLNIAIAEVSASLGDLPDSLTEVDGRLQAQEETLTAIESELLQLADNSQEINASLDAAITTLNDYHEVITKLDKRISQVSQNLTDWIDQAAWIGTMLLIWLFISQLGLFVQGYSMVAPRNISKD